MMIARSRIISKSIPLLTAWLLAGLMAAMAGRVCAQQNPDNNAARTEPALRVWQDNPYGIPVTRWMDRDGRRPITYREWKATLGDSKPFAAKTIVRGQPAGNARAGDLFSIIVNADLYPHIATSLDQYILDVQADGFTVDLHTITGGTPLDLRGFLQQQHDEGTVGAVLIGDLPVAWYESECWDPVAHEEFPCDLFYMDLDGTWMDIDTDGMFDFHYGAIAPDIWIGRLTPSPLTYGGADEVSLLENYFYKNHRYRTGHLILADRGLAFVDDDWEWWAPEWSDNLGLAYPDRTTVSDPSETTAPNYAGHLPQNYEAILVCAHSSPAAHWFKIPPEQWTTIDYSQIIGIDPVAVFYNLFACSNARYVETNYMSGWYIFCPSYGLASVGSTKTGSMLNFAYFYDPFASGKTIGESFADWFTMVAGDGTEPWEICWHYGMTLCGDPTLIRHPFVLPQITTETLPAGTHGQTYECPLEAVGGIAPYTWKIIDGGLPAGLGLDSPGGIISGTPLEVGTFAILLQLNDAAEPAHADTAGVILDVTYVCGDANFDAMVNIADAVYIITYVFKNGPAPLPQASGDANCDGAVNVADAVYTVNYVFSNGPLPCCR